MSGNRFAKLQDFPTLSQTIDSHPIIYLDSAATTLKPQVVIDAVCNYYSTNGANIHRGKHRLSEEASSAYEDSRLMIADYVGAQSDELVFTENATHALNIVAHGLTLSSEDLILTGLDSHHSNILPWRQYGNLEFFLILKDGRVDLNHFESQLKKRPRVVSLTHCSNVSGVIHQIETMVKMIRSLTDAIIVLDASQSIPHQRINMKILDVDYIVFSGHKMLGPTGLGFLGGSRKNLENLKPLLYGGGTVDWVDEKSQIPRRAPYHLEAGTPSIASVIGMSAAIRYLLKLSNSDRKDHDQKLTQALIDGANSRDYLSLIGLQSTESRHGIGSFRFSKKVPVSELARLLSDSYGIMCRSGYLCAQPFVQYLVGNEVLRVSTYIYNEVSEIEATFSALDELSVCMGMPSLDKK